MSRLSRLMGKPLDVNIGGEVYTIRPLGVENLDLVFDLESGGNKIDDRKKVEAVKKLVFMTLKTSVPDATDDEIRGIKMEYVKDFISAILKVNGLIPEDAEVEEYAKAMAAKNVDKGKDSPTQ